ncbi:MAG: DUF2809 domain-containing protein [Ginsengibacter sp.]
MHCNKSYCIIATFILVVEVMIALFVHDSIVRPYIGDFLVVILIYCFLKSFLTLAVWPTAISVLLFSYAVEISQYYHVINKLGLQNSKLARIVMGTSFAWIDMIIYTAGIALVIFIETTFSPTVYKKQSKKTR